MDDPKCFISYSWDGDNHRSWVRKLATDLQSSGVEVLLDQWDTHPGMDITEYMETSIRKAGYVLLVCTPRFATKANLRKGGVGYEQSVVTGEIFANAATPGKFVPILRLGSTSESIPSFLKSRLFIDFRDDHTYYSVLEDLLRHIYKKRKYGRPLRGKRPTFTDLSSVALPASKKKTIDTELVQKLKEFAYTSSGLDMTSSAAAKWALNNWRRFTKQDFSDFVSRVKSLKNFAYESSGLNMISTRATEWALEYESKLAVVNLPLLIKRFKELKEFAYSSSGLDMISSKATQWALSEALKEFGLSE